MLSFSTCLYPQALCISQVSPNRTCSMEIYYEDLAHVSVEAKKSHYLLSASWTPRKGGVVIQSRSGGLRTVLAKHRRDERSPVNSEAGKVGAFLLPPPVLPSDPPGLGAAHPLRRASLPECTNSHADLI